MQIMLAAYSESTLLMKFNVPQPLVLLYVTF